MNSLDQQAIQIADEIVAGGLARRVEIKSNTGTYWYLATPDAYTAQLTVIASPGSPEICGVWSYTLLTMGLLRETSLAAYFESFRHAGLGLIVINPNGNGPDLIGESFIAQFSHAADSLGSAPFGLLGFSMGGGMALQFIESSSDISGRVAGLALIDPTLPGRIQPRRSTAILRNKTLLISSEEPMSPGQLAGQLLDLPAVAYPGLHGEMPYKAREAVTAFFVKQKAIASC